MSIGKLLLFFYYKKLYLGFAFSIFSNSVVVSTSWVKGQEHKGQWTVQHGKCSKCSELKCNGCMPVRAVCKPHSPDLKRGALATDARGCSLWRSLLECPPPAPESRVRDPLGELVRTRVGGVTLVPWPGREWGLGG